MGTCDVNKNSDEHFAFGHCALLLYLQESAFSEGS